MKKLFRILSIAALLVACLMVNTSCDKLLDKVQDKVDVYGFGIATKVNENCDISALTSVYEKYSAMKLTSINTKAARAKEIWNEAEAAFKAVEPKLVLDKGCGVKIVMERCSHVDGEYKPVETIGEWSFYNK